MAGLSTPFLSFSPWQGLMAGRDRFQPALDRLSEIKETLFAADLWREIGTLGTFTVIAIISILLGFLLFMLLSR